MQYMKIQYMKPPMMRNVYLNDTRLCLPIVVYILQTSLPLQMRYGYRQKKRERMALHLSMLAIRSLLSFA